MKVLSIDIDYIMSNNCNVYGTTFFVVEMQKKVGMMYSEKVI